MITQGPDKVDKKYSLSYSVTPLSLFSLHHLNVSLSSLISQYLLPLPGTVFFVFVFLCVRRTHRGTYIHKAHITTYTQHSNTITSGRWLLENHLNLSSSQSWKRGVRFPSNIKGEVVASVPASLHLSPVYSNHTAAVSSPAFILLYFSISLFCFSPDRDWVSSAPGE